MACQWIRSIVVLYTRRSFTVKILLIVLMFAIFECLYKISFLETTHNDSKDKIITVDCTFPGKHSQLEKILCFGNASSYTNKVERPSGDYVRTTDAPLDRPDIVLNNTPTPSPIRQTTPLMNMTILLEEILMDSSPFPVNNPHPYKNIMTPKECVFNGDRLSILIMVYSSPGNIYQRKVMRRTLTEVKDSNVRWIFLLGFHEESQYMVEDESDQFRDILQENFQDSNRNSSLKIIMGYNWVVKKCPTASVIVSLNDTLQVKSRMLFEYIRDVMIQTPTNLYQGNVEKNGHFLRKTLSGYQNYTNNDVISYVTSNISIVSRDVVTKFQTIFPFVEILEDNVGSYLGSVASIMSIKPSHDSYFDPEQPFSYFTSSGKDISSDLLSYPLTINLRRLVRRKLIYGEKILHEPINNKDRTNFLHNATRCNFATDIRNTDNVLVMIWSDPSDREQRQALRELWDSVDNVNVRRMFVLGWDDADPKVITQENSKYGDVIQIESDDEKMFNTIKAVSTFNWILKYCRKVNYVIFVDGSINVNINKITAYMQELIESKRKNVYTGHVTDAWKSDRDRSSRSYVNEADYPYDQIPPFILGGNYVISFSYVKHFSVAFPYVKYCPITDIYMGVVASKLMVTPTHDPHFDRTSPKSIFRDDVP